MKKIVLISFVFWICINGDWLNLDTAKKIYFNTERFAGNTFETLVIYYGTDNGKDNNYCVKQPGKKLKFKIIEYLQKSNQ